MSRHTRRLAIVPPAFQSGFDLAYDTFTDTAGVLLDDHKPDLGGRWVRAIINGFTGNIPGAPVISNAGRLRKIADSPIRAYYHSSYPPTPNYEVSCDVVLLDDNNLASGGPAGRIQSLENGYLYMRYNCNGNFWQVFSNTVATATQIGSNVPQELTIGQAYRATLRMVGNVVTGLVDGVEIISGTSDAILSRGRAGFRIQQTGSDTTGLHIDNWQAVAL